MTPAAHRESESFRPKQGIASTRALWNGGAMFLRIVFAGLWLLTVSAALAQRLSPLALPPDWSQLEKFQETITHEEFVQLLDQVYAPAGAAKGMVDVEADVAVIKTALTPPAEWRLRFCLAGLCGPFGPVAATKLSNLR